MTANRRIKHIAPISAPQELLAQYPLDPDSTKLVNATRKAVSDILHKRDRRLLVVMGPCSIHDPEAAREYAGDLVRLRRKYQDTLEIVMRVYFEKPRTTIGWKGLINDPDLNGSYNVNKGLEIARKLLLELNAMGLPAGCEFLDAVTGQYYADLVSWGAIGARTTESQIHRELASGLSCPVGFKNGTNGNVDIAADAVVAAASEHVFLSPTEQGRTALFTTTGNRDAHVILRGGKLPNYDSQNVAAVAQTLRTRGIETGIMIDASHANCQKQHRQQLLVVKDIAEQVSKGNRDIVGCMIESHIHEGNQSLTSDSDLSYGVSITDACINLEQSEMALELLAASVV